MEAKLFSYPLVIKETYLDSFGHMNNATYLTLFEEARWDLITQNGYGINKMVETGLGPTILEVTVKFLRELRPRDEVVIETQLLSYEKKIGKLMQNMLRGKEVCCSALFIFGLFSLEERKLVIPTPDWLKAIGVDT